MLPAGLRGSDFKHVAFEPDAGGEIVLVPGGDEKAHEAAEPFGIQVVQLFVRLPKGRFGQAAQEQAAGRFEVDGCTIR